MQEQNQWTRFEEPIGRTLTRNLIIAAVLGTAVAAGTHHLGRMVAYTILALWFSLGGHYIEVLFLNGIRPRIADTGLAQRAVRIVVWLAGGTALYLGMAATARVLTRAAPPMEMCWVGGLALIGIELIVHAALARGGASNFYNGAG